MSLIKNKESKKAMEASIIGKYVKVGRSIYGRVIFIITILSLFLFISFGVIFKSVNRHYLNGLILQNGNNVGSLVEGALYHSMLSNDKSSLQSTLDVINTMPGIEDVSMYDVDHNLVYSSFSSDTIGHFNPNCKSCHSDMSTMFPGKIKTYKIITASSECKMKKVEKGQRHLLIHSPILNTKSCYQSTCHYHKATDGVLGSLVIKVPLKEFDAAVQKTSLKFFLFATLATLLLVAFLMLFTSREIKNPLKQIIKASVAVSNGDRSKRLEIRPRQLDDIRMVSTAFNDMLDNLEAAQKELENWSQQLEYKVQKKTEELGAAQSELIHVDRLASLGKLSSSVAHEINNPLSGILIYTKLIHKQLSNPLLTEEKKELMLKHLKLIESETKRCGEIVKGLLEFSRKDEDNLEPRHLNQIMSDTFDLMIHPIVIENISFQKHLDAKQDMIYCSPNQIKQACVAMLVNASEAVTENGEITMKTYNPDDTSIVLEITDNGKGISEEDIPHIFEPFFSTKMEASGIGLGLAIAHGILQSHKAKTVVKSKPGQGTTIQMTFPLIRE